MNAASNGTVPVGDERYIVLTGAYDSMTVARHDGTYMSRLTIHNATERHTGFYVCSASNTGSFNSVGAYLQVLSPSESTLLLLLAQATVFGRVCM